MKTAISEPTACPIASHLEGTLGLYFGSVVGTHDEGSFENLALRRLPETVADIKVAEELPGLIEETRTRTKFARVMRNKRFAHQELSLALDSKAGPLPSASRHNVERALHSLRKVMNKLHGAYLTVEVAYEHVLIRDDASDLVQRLAVAA